MVSSMVPDATISRQHLAEVSKLKSNIICCSVLHQKGDFKQAESFEEEYVPAKSWAGIAIKMLTAFLYLKTVTHSQKSS